MRVPARGAIAHTMAHLWDESAITTSDPKLIPQQKATLNLLARPAPIDAPPSRTYTAPPLASTRTLSCGTNAQHSTTPRPRIPAPPRPLHSPRHTTLHLFRPAPPTIRILPDIPLQPLAIAAQSLTDHIAHARAANLPRLPTHTPDAPQTHRRQRAIRAPPRPRDPIFALATPLRSLSQNPVRHSAVSPTRLRDSDRDPAQSS